MSTTELKHIITDRISLIEDVEFLKALKTIIDSKVATTVYNLSELQKERIKLGDEQLLKGRTISDEELQKEISQWLNSK